MEQLANNPVTTLSSSINNSVTSMTVASGSAFPTSGDFTVKIGTELIRVTGVSGTTWTIVRGQESTTAASHSSGDPVTQIITSNVVSRLLTEMLQIGGYASRPSTVRAGTEYIASDLGNVSWKYNGTDWSLSKPLYVSYANRVNVGSWTDLNNTGLTWNDYNGVNMPTLLGASGDHIRGKYHTIPTAPFTSNVIIGAIPLAQAHVASGLFLYDSGTTKCKFIILDGYDNGQRFVVENWTDPNTFSSSIAGTNNLYCPNPWAYIRFQDDNTNWNYYWSWDGTNWIKYFSEVRNSFLTPTHIGIGFYKQNDYLSTNSTPFQLYGYWEA